MAQDKPKLKILGGFSAGGSVDVLARIVGDAARDDYASVMVDNKPGAAGRIALMQVKNAKPDGQTVIILPMVPMVIFPHTYKKLDYDAFKDFTPVSQLAVSQFGVARGPSAGASSVKEMLAKVKADPKLGNYGTPGAGSVPHFLGVDDGASNRHTFWTMCHFLAAHPPIRLCLVGMFSTNLMWCLKLCHFTVMAKSKSLPLQAASAIA